jgi:menaquinone-dependent protoporphyrinogen oxidase
MTTVLVAYGSKTGGTAEIAQRIAETLMSRGLEVAVAPPARVAGRYDAAIVGSALYANRWRGPAIGALKRLAKQPPDHVWLFHSGPLGEQADEPQPLPKAVKVFADRVGARDVVTFGGRLEAATAKGWIARAMIRNGKGGDFRDLDAVDAWATGIADELGA